MTHSLFDNAKFGDIFITVEKKQAVFLRLAENAEYKFAILYVEDWGMVQVFRHNGKEIHNDAAHSIISKQEEPVSDRFAFKAIPRLLEMIEPTDRAKAYIAKLADALEVEGYSTDAKIVRESLKIMNGEKVPMATMDGEPVSEQNLFNVQSFIKKWKEPVSEELEEAAFDYAEACKYDGGEKLLCVEHFKAGSKWKEKKDQETIETAIHHAYHNGRLEMKEQMLAKAVVHEVKVDAGGYPYIPQMELYNYDKDVPLAKDGDRYKVVLIKED